MRFSEENELTFSLKIFFKISIDQFGLFRGVSEAESGEGGMNEGREARKGRAIAL